jgi:hypothetical protein
MNSTKMCLSGRIPGSSSKTPAGISMNSPCGEASGTGLPQFEQNVDWYGGGL